MWLFDAMEAMHSAIELHWYPWLFDAMKAMHSAIELHWYPWLFDAKGLCTVQLSFSSIDGYFIDFNCECCITELILWVNKWDGKYIRRHATEVCEIKNSSRVWAIWE